MTGYYPPQVAELYAFPEGHGKGQNIAIIEDSGGYNIDCLNDYFLGTLGLPQAPTVKSIELCGRVNHHNATVGEVYLDIEVAGAIAYEATLNVYFTSPGADGLKAAVSQAMKDGNDVITMSVGGIHEQRYKPADRKALDALFKQAGERGITVLHGAGDRGAWGQKCPLPTPADHQACVNYPPSSHWVTACGGTSLPMSGPETAWSQAPGGGGATGGGVSAIYDVPHYQKAAGIEPMSVNGTGPGRGLPDVAAVADPATGYRISVAGEPKTVGGDSAAGPLWAALVAILNQNLGRNLGFLNPLLYGGLGASDGFNDITSGDNTVTYDSVTVPGYSAGPGWDLCTGYGSPRGTNLLARLQSL